MDYVRTRGAATFGTRLRRLSERIDREVQEIYRAAGVDFEPRWFAVFSALKDDGPATVGELAERIGVTHAAVSQVRSALAARGLITATTDPKDERRQRLELTAEGRAAAARLEPLWAAIASATQDLQQAAPGLTGELDRLEAALAEEPLRSRVFARLDPPPLAPADA